MFKGYASQLKLDGDEVAYATVEPIRAEQHGASIVAHQFVRLVGSDAAEAASAERDIKATAHAALKGDVIRVTSGTYSGREVKVRSVGTDNIYLVDKITLANTDTFEIYRHKYPTVTAAGLLETTATLSGAIQYDLNGSDVEVHMDTGTPANSRPLPVQYLNSSGVRTNLATETTVATLATQTTLAALLTELQLKADLTETQPISAASLPLPTGAATETTLASLLTELQLKADLTETQPVSAASLPLPTGAATSANQTTEITHLSQIETAVEAIQSNNFTQLAALLTEMQLKADLTENQPVALKDGSGNAITSELLGAKRGLNNKPIGYAVADSATKLSGTVTSGAWVELIASTAAEAHFLQCFESSGYALELGVGAAAAEVRQCFIPPGGTDYPLPLRIPAGSRVSVRAVATTADYTSPAQLLLTLLG